MDRELELQVCGESLKIFFPEGFFDMKCKPTYLHVHSATELQVVARGSALLRSAEKEVELLPDTLTVVPAGLFHEICSVSEDSVRIAFQVVFPREDLSRVSLPKGVAAQLAAEVERYISTGQSKRLCAYISLLCTELFAEQSPPFRENEDRAFIINDYFSKNYGEGARLCDLAKRLGVSEKQAGRLVVQNMGRGFREELGVRRIAMAKRLMTSGETSLAKISELVGYRSYSGFWKAFSREKTWEGRKQGKT